MSILDSLGLIDNVFVPYLNTGTHLDLATGVYVPGINGEMLLNGGLGLTMGIVGRPQMYKSTKALSITSKILDRYKEVEAIVLDTEFAIPSPTRFDDLTGNGHKVSDRVKLIDISNYDMSSFNRLIRDLVKHKIENKKDYIVDTPFLDPKTLKPLKIFIPTIVVIDSISKLGLAKESELYDKHDLGDSQLNMVYMQDGNAKTQFIRQIPTLAAKAGIYFVITAHIGDKFNLDPYAPTPKDLQYMKGSDSIKGTGSQFTFLTSILLESRAVKVLQDSNKECQYPTSFSTATELNQVTSVVCRCKNNVSGTQIDSVISQYQGILSGLSNYHFLRKHNNFGLDGSNLSQTCKLYPNVKLERKTVRDEITKSYELERALEILGQLCYIKNYWSSYSMRDAVDFNIRPSVFVDKVLKGGAAMADILNSRSHWTIDKKDPRKYMSIYDILKIIKDMK